MENKTPALRSYIFCLECGSHISPITDPDKDKSVTIKLSELRVRAQPEQGSSQSKGSQDPRGTARQAGRAPQQDVVSQHLSKMTRAGLMMVTTGSCAPAVTRQVHRDEAGLRSSQKSKSARYDSWQRYTYSLAEVRT